MSLAPGVRLGVYEITAQIGEGGMGRVYKARDTTLNRDVALKVLPDVFADDPDRLARFTREAQTLASLSHPNIAAIFGVEDSNGVRALVMEFVPGEDLAQRIAKGAMPLDEVLPIARQIAQGLEVAHEQGIVHRDLKPANIKVRPDGTVKVLDFGLAKAMEPAGPTAHDPAYALSQAPTITTPAMTQAGMILGTAAYMSPEQARGKPVDKRTDIWAFGCVVYEMLTGRRAFEAEDVSLTMARVLEREPDWTMLPSALPSAVGLLLRRSLAKDPRQRIGDVAVAIFVLDDASTLDPTSGLRQHEATTAAAAFPVAVRGKLATLGALTLLVVATVAAATTWYLIRPLPPRVARLEVVTAGDQAMNAVSDGDRDLAITRDGSRIVYKGTGALFVRALDRLDPTVIRGLGRVRGVFVSPDGEWAGFWGDGLQKVALSGGPPVTITPPLLQGASRGATWGEDGTIVYATSVPGSGLYRVSATGGEATVLTVPDKEAGEGLHAWPEFLPGGQALLFTILPSGERDLERAQIALLDLRTGTYRVLLQGGHHAQYVSPGYLVYGAGGTLRAVAFDLNRSAVVSAPFGVVERVRTKGDGGLDAAISANGTLVYALGGVGEEGGTRSLVWVDRNGREEAVSGAPENRQYTYPRLSPDGSRVALDIRDQERDIWIWGFERQTLTRFTFGPEDDQWPVWTRNGQRLVWASRSQRDAGVFNVFMQSADGTGPVERLTEGPHSQRPTAVTREDRLLLGEDPEAGGRPGTVARQNLAIMPLAGRASPAYLMPTPFDQRNGEVSPDGRWLAYESNESGEFEIYVRPFPGVQDGRWQVSSNGGRQPLWARDGRELFYWGSEGALMGVTVEAPSGGKGFAARRPTQIIEPGYYTAGGGILGRTYDISPDGRRFLVIKQSRDPNEPLNLVVVQHWQEELKRLVPTN